MKMNTNDTVQYKEFGGSFYLRSMFYLLTPEETYFKKLEDIPPIVSKVSYFFVGFIILEYILMRTKANINKSYRVNDSLTSLSAGLISRIPETFFRSFHIVTYTWVYDNYNIITLPYNYFVTYIVTLLLMDHGYYWFHRMAHEVNIFWAAHQVHHSSEDYNLTTALRQSVLQIYTSWIFYLPIALFIPPQVFIIHSIMNLLYQFWIHTEVIESFGFLDGFISLIFNTPSAHRVHHGRNPYCIDKNYAGFLIIWDRIYGTYAEEKKDEKVAYGLVHNLENFNPFYVQFCHLKYIFEQLVKEKSWSNKISILFKGPGWQPGTGRLGDYNMIPQVENPIKKYNPDISLKLTMYVLAHFLFMFYTTGVVIDNHKTLNSLKLLTYWSIVFYNLISFASIFDKRWYALHLDTIRCLLWLVYDISDRNFVFKLFLKSNNISHFLFILANSASILIMTFVLLTKADVVEKREIKDEIKKEK